MGESTRWDQQLESSEVLWQSDNSRDYEVDYHALVIEKNTGRVLYVSASGCSCWDGDAYADDMGSLRDALGPLGVPVSIRDAAFDALCEQHGIPPTSRDSQEDA